MDYAKCAKEVHETLGGRSNLVSAAHCATRLRLVTVDNSKIDRKKLENIDGFGLLVSEGDKVKAGQKLMTFDIAKSKAAGYSTTTAVL